MEQLNIKAHIEAKNDVKNHLEKVWTSIVVLNEVVGLSESTMKELQTKISSKIAQCDISIRDHQKLLKPYMSKEQQELLDEAYENYLQHYDDEYNEEQKKIQKNTLHWMEMEYTNIRPYPKETFINKCKSDTEFSQKWGLQIEERELTTVRERKKYDIHFDDLIGEYPDHHETLDKRGVPKKITTITYNDKTITNYE